MTGYTILIVFGLVVAACFFSFFGGLRFGKKQTEAKYEEERRKKEQSEKEFKQAESEIKQEVFNEAEIRKAEISKGDNDRERFDTINDSLRNNPPR